MERWSASSAHADMSATAACALGPHGGVALGSGVFGHPPLESGAAIAVAFWTREKSVSAPPAVATAADICARWGPNSPLPSGVPSIARSSAVMDAASGGVIANPSACALARSIAAPMIRTRGARTSPGVSAGAASKSRAILQPSGPSFTALRCASAAASVAGSPGERSARAAVIAAATVGSAIVQPSGRARVPRARASVRSSIVHFVFFSLVSSCWPSHSPCPRWSRRDAPLRRRAPIARVSRALVGVAIPPARRSRRRISVATLAMHYACVVVAASDGGDRAGGDRPPSRPDARKSSSQTCIEPDTETTALAIVRDTPLSPLMGRLRQKHREFHYPEIGLTLRLNQRWDAAGAGTGAAVWDSAELLARYMASSGAARAFNPDALKDDAEAAGAGAGVGSRDRDRRRLQKQRCIQTPQRSRGTGGRTPWWWSWAAGSVYRPWWRRRWAPGCCAPTGTI